MSDFLNHRLNNRNPVAIPTQVYHQNDKIRSATITDLSLDGAYTLLDDAKQLPINDIVKIKFTLTDHNDTHQLLLPAIIVHHETNGLGIMFINEDQEFSQLINIISTSHPQASEPKSNTPDSSMASIKYNARLKPIQKAF